jgi:hypothetical protein
MSLDLSEPLFALTMAQRALQALTLAAKADAVSPEVFKVYTDRIARSLLKAEAAMMAAEAASELGGGFGLTDAGRAAVLGLPLCSVKFRGHLGVIEGGAK